MARRRALLFQSRSGFSGFCDIPAARRTTAVDVSIPFWVFWVLRRHWRCRVDDVHEGVSIPFWVFWVLRPEELRAGGPERRVSIPFWVFWVLRRSGEQRNPERNRVSIPFWVFWVLRRDGRAAARELRRGFNPVLGFLGSATNDRLDRVEKAVKVSIPFWVFWVLRLVQSRYMSRAAAFQSRSGFSGFCDRNLQIVSPAPQFQSRSGFSGFCDAATGNAWRASVLVSIPFWVFWVLRHFRPDIVFGRAVFQSRSGFSGFCDHWRRRGCWI